MQHSMSFRASGSSTLLTLAKYQWEFNIPFLPVKVEERAPRRAKEVLAKSTCLVSLKAGES